ncbi:hypothetical protein BC679P5_00036 [Bacteroides phage BC679P5]|nr:hypothetical protein BC679P5_00036 [Bacteroides phage BC679P5]
MSKGNNHLKLEDMKKYYVNGKEISELEKRSKKMQELLSAIKDMTYEEITAIRGTMWWRSKDKKQLIVRNADKRDLEYALRIAPKAFKVNQSSNI